MLALAKLKKLLPQLDLEQLMQLPINQYWLDNSYRANFKQVMVNQTMLVIEETELEHYVNLVGAACE